MAFNFTPSSELCHYDVGDIFTLNRKQYVLISRNAVSARVERWYWWDQFIRDFVSRLRRNGRK